MNNINELFNFFFGPQGDAVRLAKGNLSQPELREIILNYSLADIYSIQENQASLFTLTIDKDSLDFRYDFFSEIPLLASFSEVAKSFKLELDSVTQSLQLELAPKEAEVSLFLSDLLYNSIMIDYAEGGGDKFVQHLEEIKTNYPETYLIFKTFMTHRPQIWTAIVSSVANRNTPADKMKKIVFALTDLMSSGFYYIKEVKNNSALKVKNYLEITNQLQEVSDSTSAFLCFLLKNPRQFPLSSI